MARYTGPKDRLSRREGFDLFGQGVKIPRLNILPGVHGPKGTLKISQFGKQLREKQKVKRMYGLMEKQFESYVVQAMRTRGNTTEKILALLEKRLDNVVYRLGFASTRSGARQLVSHGHVQVDGNKLNIASYQLKVGQVISLPSKVLEIPVVKKLLEDKEKKTPLWIEKKAAVGKIVREPKSEDVQEPISMQDIVEFYSR